MKKIEKLIITPVFWIYVVVLIGFVFAALFGGRGGVIFVELAFWAGCGVGLIRTVYLGFTYDEKLVDHSTSKLRVVARRIFFGLFYAPLLYSGFRYIASEEWNNPYTYEWGESTEMYISRDGQIVVPPTIIDYRRNNGHYYGLRMAIDHLSCNPGSASITASRFSNRRIYFILPIAEDAAIEFTNSDEFEAELKRRVPSGADKLDYSIFQEKWDYYSAIDARSKQTNCVIEEGP